MSQKIILEYSPARRRSRNSAWLIVTAAGMCGGIVLSHAAYSFPISGILIGVAVGGTATYAATSRPFLTGIAANAIAIASCIVSAGIINYGTDITMGDGGVVALLTSFVVVLPGLFGSGIALAIKSEVEVKRNLRLKPRYAEPRLIPSPTTPAEGRVSANLSTTHRNTP